MLFDFHLRSWAFIRGEYGFLLPEIQKHNQPQINAHERR
jgi:hypothetical protein